MRILTVEIALTHLSPDAAASVLRDVADVLRTGLVPDEHFHLVRASPSPVIGTYAQAWIDPQAQKLSRVQ